MELLRALDRPIAFHRVFVHLTGSITAALFLSQALYWTLRLDDDRDGWFYKDHRDWKEETGMTRHEQRGARKKLRELGLLQEKRSGQDPTLWFKLNIELLSSKIAVAKFATAVSDNAVAMANIATANIKESETTKDYNTGAAAGARKFPRSQGKLISDAYQDAYKAELGKIPAWSDVDFKRIRQLLLRYDGDAKLIAAAVTLAYFSSESVFRDNRHCFRSLTSDKLMDRAVGKVRELRRATASGEDTGADLFAEQEKTYGGKKG